MYIRTDEGHIYERIEQRIMKCVFLGGELYRHNLNSKWENIIDQADTIEELCDELVIHRKEMNYNFVWNEDRNIGLNYFCSLPEKYDVYGCIWTDKGLIYVAKMDNDGKLVLI